MLQSRCAAKHRIEGLRKPRGRFIVFLDVVVATAEEVMLRRSGEESDHAHAFLSEVTEEDVLQTAMVSDGMDEGMVLEAFPDDDGVDVGEMNRERVLLSGAHLRVVMRWSMRRGPWLYTRCAGAVETFSRVSAEEGANTHVWRRDSREQRHGAAVSESHDVMGQTVREYLQG